MAKTYGAINPEQLARLFEMRKDIAQTFRDQVKAKPAKQLLQREIEIWAEAAFIVRNTEFVGWNASLFEVKEI